MSKSQMTVNVNAKTINQMTNLVPNACNDNGKEPNIEDDSPDWSKDTKLYYMDKAGTPKVLVIANYLFDKSPKLIGHEKDYHKLKAMWEDDFKTAFIGEKNLTADQILRQTERFSARHLTGQERYCAVFILSHGTNGDRIVGTDEKNVSFDEILSHFNNRNMKLRGMPKLFFFQCCRGLSVDKGVPASKAASSNGAHQAEKLPEVSDTLVMLATQRDKISIVDEDGSWMVKELVDVFQNYHRKEDVTSMLTIVNKQISNHVVQHADDDEDIIGAKCMSEYRSNLTAKLMLSSSEE